MAVLRSRRLSKYLARPLHGGTGLAEGGATQRRGRRSRSPSLWVLAGALLAIAVAAFVCATRLGEDADRREEAEAVFFRLEARAYEQSALEGEAIQAGAPLDAELASWGVAGSGTDFVTRSRSVAGSG